ncbi:MAG TPA: hypothetical protein VHK88_19910 [Aquihabitans sp.]|jgi:hypothetical protein|nr:hypothetical protein [Aquihabitans sp.]
MIRARFDRTLKRLLGVRRRPCSAIRGTSYPYERGWFATGHGVGYGGPIRWGRRIGWARAWVDAIRLERRDRRA